MSDCVGVKDVWLSPIDSRRSAASGCQPLLLNTVLGLAGLIGLIVGAVALATEDWTTKPGWIRGFVLCTMCLEALVWILTGVSAGMVYLTLGRTALIHALSVLSISSDAMLSLAYTCTSCWGLLAIRWLYETGAFANLANGTLAPTTTAGVPLQLYIVASWIASTGYAVSKIPTLVGALAFATNHVKRKLQHAPIVRFYTEYNRGDEYYIRVMPLEECSELVENMNNPLY